MLCELQHLKVHGSLLFTHFQASCEASSSSSSSMDYLFSLVNRVFNSIVQFPRMI